jgi:hypothetical protein
MEQMVKDRTMEAWLAIAKATTNKEKKEEAIKNFYRHQNKLNGQKKIWETYEQ